MMPLSEAERRLVMWQLDRDWSLSYQPHQPAHASAIAALLRGMAGPQHWQGLASMLALPLSPDTVRDFVLSELDRRAAPCVP